ncbi:MAG: hypothetical protein LQ339_004534 [Xanthoria mediterranea]|nr:MAG: hypothetical protein LQ339_004534 [Xanthoria mediterranea]
MSLSSSYTETCTLAAQVRRKFQGQYGTNKDQNLRLIVAHAQLYDRLDHHITSLKTIGKLHAGGEQPFAPAVDVPNHQDPFRMNQQPELQRSRSSSSWNPPWHPLKLAAESADENDEDPKPPSKPSDPTCSVSIDEVEDLENPDHEQTTSEPHASPCLTGIPFTMVTNKSPCSTDYTSQTVISETFIEDPSDSDSDCESDCDIESSSSDYDGDLDPDDVTIHPQPMNATPAPMPKPNPSQPRIRWQDQESDKGLKISDIVPQDAPKIKDLPTLERCSAPPSLSKPQRKEPRTEEADCTPHNNNGPRAAISVAALRKTAPLAPLLCGDAADVAADQVHLERGVLRKVHHRLADCQKDGEDASAITSSIAGKIPALAYWIFRGGKA